MSGFWITKVSGVTPEQEQAIKAQGRQDDPPPAPRPKLKLIRGGEED